MMYPFVLAVIISVIISNFNAVQQTSMAIAKQYQANNKARILSIGKNIETQIVNAIGMYVKHNANYVYNQIKTDGYFNIYLTDLSSFLVQNLDTNMAYGVISKIKITKTTLTIYYVFNINDYNNYIKYTQRNSSEIQLPLPTFAANALKIEEQNVAHSDTNQLLIIPYSNLTIEKSIKASAKFLVVSTIFLPIF